MRSSPLSALLFLLFALAPAGASPQEQPARVGALGDVSRMEFRGVKTYTGEEIVHALVRTPRFLIASHSRAPLDEYLRFIETRVSEGYRHGGFPHVRVTAAAGDDRQRIVVDVAEGRRLVAGEVEVVGAVGLPASAVVTELTEERTADATFHTGEEAQEVETEDAFWVRGEPAQLDGASLRRAGALAREAYGRAGFIDASVEAEVSYDAETAGEATLRIKVLAEGPRYRLGEVRFEGGLTDDTNALRRLCGLETGMFLRADLTDRVEAVLESLGRYYRTAARFEKTGNEKVLDLAIELEQAEFAGPLDAEPDETHELVRHGVRRLLERADSTLVVKLELSESAEVAPGSTRGASFFEAAVAPEGMLILSDLPALLGFPPGTLGLVAHGRRVLLTSAPARIRSLADGLRGARIEIRVAVSAQHPPGNDGERFALNVGASVVSADANEPFRVVLKPEISEIALRQLIAEKLVFEPDGDALLIDFVKGDERLRLARLDRESGDLRFDFVRRSGPMTVTVRSVEDFFPGRFDAAEADSLRLGLEDVSPAAFVARTVADVASALERVRRDEAGNPDAASFVVAQLTRELCRDGGLLVRLLERLGRRSPAKPSFRIPFDASILGKGHAQQGPVQLAAAPMLTPVVARIAPLFPDKSWPRVLLVESLCVFAGQARFSGEVFREVYESNEVGPIGSWASAEVLELLGLGAMSRELAGKASRECGADGFAKEIALLAETSPELLETIGRVLQGLDREELAKVQGDAAQDDARQELHDLVREAGSLEAAEAGKRALEFLWRHRLQALVQERARVLRGEGSEL